MSKDVEEANPSVDDGSLRTLDYGRALWFGMVSLLPPSTEAGITKVALMIDITSAKTAKAAPRIQKSADSSTQV